MYVCMYVCMYVYLLTENLHFQNHTKKINLNNGLAVINTGNTKQYYSTSVILIRKISRHNSVCRCVLAYV